MKSTPVDMLKSSMNCANLGMVNLALFINVLTDWMGVLMLSRSQNCLLQGAHMSKYCKQNRPLVLV